MKPKARITLDGKDVTDKWGSVLESITVTDEAGIKSDTCEISFDNRERFSAPPIGAEIKIWLGYEPEPVYLGKFKIDQWTKSKAPLVLRISAKAAEMTSEIRAPKVRSFHDKTVKQIVDQIAGDNRLTANVDAEIGGRKIDHIDQQTESDLNFLTRLAKRQGATFKLADGKILFAAKGSKKAPSGKAKAAITIKETSASSWSATSGERGNYKSASATYIDPATKKRKTVKTGSGKPQHRDRHLYGSKAEADAAAKATLGDLKRGKVEVSIDMPGDPTIYAEAMVTLKDYDPDIDGTYLAKSVAHTFDRGGYRTSVTLETEGTGDTEGTGTDPE